MHDGTSPYNSRFLVSRFTQSVFRAFKKETAQWYLCYIVLPWQNDERTVELVPRQYSRGRKGARGCGCGGFGVLSPPASKKLLFRVCCVWLRGVTNTRASHHCVSKCLLWSLWGKSKWKTCVDSRFHSRNPASDLSFWSLNMGFFGPSLQN